MEKAAENTLQLDCDVSLQQQKTVEPIEEKTSENTLPSDPNLTHQQQMTVETNEEKTPENISSSASIDDNDKSE